MLDGISTGAGLQTVFSTPHPCPPQSLAGYLERHSNSYTALLAFKPTGWSYSEKKGLAGIQPRVSGNVTVYGKHCTQPFPMSPPRHLTPSLTLRHPILGAQRV